MINKKNKMLGLAMASVIGTSLLPVGAMASEKIETQDGSISNAVVYNGKVVYKGEIEENDDDVIKYNEGDIKDLSEDKAIESSDDEVDIEDGEIVGTYGDKYVIVEESGDEYLVDMTSGRAEDETIEDKSDDLQSSLKSKFKKLDRYNVENEDDITLERFSNDNFADNWYLYKAKTEDNLGDKSTPAETYYGLTDEDGKYIDINFTANVYAYSSAQGKVVKIKEYNDIDKDSMLEANLKSVSYIGQDSNNVYVLSEVLITDTNKTENATETLSVIQKISKAQGDEEDEAYIPKSVESYEVASDKYDSNDVTKGATAFKEADKVTLVNGTLYAVKASDDEVTVTTLKLKKERVSLGEDSAEYSVPVLKYEDDETQDIKSSNSVSYDVDGNIWILNKGKIMKFEGDEFKQVYKCDSSFDKLIIYDSNNLLAYEDDSDSDSFAIILNGENKATEDSDDVKDTDVDTTVDTTIGATDTSTSDAVVIEAKVGWEKDSLGNWSYYDSVGKKVVANWVQDTNGTWYYLKADGIMATGWVNVGNVWYYLDGSGAMKTGWVKDNGTWYYLQANGAMKTGWLNDNGTWYYLNTSGAMLSNTTVDGYNLGSNGAWVK